MIAMLYARRLAVGISLYSKGGVYLYKLLLSLRLNLIFYSTFFVFLFGPNGKERNKGECDSREGIRKKGKGGK